ncbi:MAG: hypothetical protein QW524_03705 [Candidatus Woesearchaeota archaeon]
MNQRRILLFVLATFLVFLGEACFAASLNDFPKMFVKDGVAKVTFVLGKRAMIYDGIAAAIILSSLQQYFSKNNIYFLYNFLLDFDVDSIDNMSAIIIGGSCANTVTAMIYDYPLNCAQPFKPGKGKIRLISDRIILVAGFYWKDTLNAAYALSNWQKQDFPSNEVEVEEETIPFLLIS